MVGKKGVARQNPLDMYLIVYIDSGEVYEEFRTVFAAVNYLRSIDLKDDLKVIKNPKYIVTTG